MTLQFQLLTTPVSTFPIIQLVSPLYLKHSNKHRSLLARDSSRLLPDQVWDPLAYVESRLMAQLDDSVHPGVRRM